jgi:hypothetical protein
MLRSGFEQGRRDALIRFGVRLAASIPTARVVPKGSGVRTPAAAPAPDGVVSLPPLPGMLSRAGTAAKGFLAPAAKALGLGALGAAGLGAYALHRQHAEDERLHRQIYTPMEGTYQR